MLSVVAILTGATSENPLLAITYVQESDRSVKYPCAETGVGVKGTNIGLTIMVCYESHGWTGQVF